MRLLDRSPAVMLNDGEGSILAKPMAAVQLTDGRILVGDESDRDIKVYDPAGRRIGTLGRRGEGPNEFRTMGGIALKGEIVIALDNSRQILNRFAASDLAPLEQISITVSGMPLSLVSGNGAELLLAKFPAGVSGGDLIAVLDTSGATRGGILDLSGYFKGDPWVIQRALPMAAASAGLTFAAAGVAEPAVVVHGGDHRVLTTIPLSLRGPSGVTSIQSARTLRGTMTAQEVAALPGGDVIHEKKFLYSMAPLPDSAVALVFRAFDVILGVDPVEPGDLVILRKCREGWRLSNAVPVPGLLAGAGQSGSLLVIGYADSANNRYLLQQMVPDFEGSETCREG